MQPAKTAAPTLSRLLSANARKAVQRLGELMDNSDSPEISRKACVDVLKLYIERTSRPKSARPPAAIEPLDDETADRLLRDLTEG